MVGSHWSHGACPTAGRDSTRSQNEAGANPVTPSGNGSRNDGHCSGGATSGQVTSVNSKPGRTTPNTAMAVCPLVAPSGRTVAVAWDIVLPRRRTVTSMSTGPGGTWAAKTVVTERSRSSGAPSSAAMARRASAVTIPPWGSTGAHHWSVSTA